MTCFKKFKSLCLTALCAGFIGLSGLSPALAQDDPGLYFYPDGSWNVAPTTGEINGDSRLCTISARMNNGFNLWITAQKNNLNSISLDIRQNAFEAGQTYDAYVSVTGSGRLPLKAKASTPSLVVLDMQRTPGFFLPLRRSDVLDIIIEDNRFRFYLNDIKSALSLYDSCTTNIAGARLVKRTKEAPPQNLIMRIKDKAFPVQEVSPAPPVIQEALKPAETDVDVLREEIARKRRERREEYTKELAQKIEAEGAQPISEAPRDIAPPAIQEDPPVIVAEDARSAVQKPATFESTPVIKAIEVAEVPVRAPKVRIITKTIKPITNYERITAEADFTSYPERKPEELRYMSEQTQTKLADMEKMIRQLKEENDMLGEDMNSMTEESRKKLMSVSSDNWNLERATMRFNESERQVKRLGQQLRMARVQCSAEKEELEAMLFDPAVTSQQQLATLAELENQLADALERLEDQRLIYDERLRTMKAQLNAKY